MALDIQALNAAPQAPPTTTISLTQMLRPQIIGGKVGVSVRDFSVYTSFKHINAMPAGGDGGGYSASRLRLLDTLIDRLIKMKEAAVDRQDYSDVSGMSSEAIDALIDEYARKYQNLSAQSADGLASREGGKFGISSADTAAYLDILA
jgi:hypothetical protein